MARILHGVDHKENEKIDRLLVLGDQNAERRAVWDKMTHSFPNKIMTKFWEQSPQEPPDKYVKSH